jgi:hypothetical protein
VFAILRHLAANPDRGVMQAGTDSVSGMTFRMAQ